ncbi:MAG: S-layer protein [Thermoclostridium sp.]|nr:S-layer protein [Thermoclostridium sp.]
MKLFTRKIITMMMAALLLAGLFFPAQQVFAAPNTTFNPSFKYDQETSRWNIEWLPIDGTSTVTAQWHNPDGTVESAADLPIVLASGKNIISLEFKPDHIYDLSFSFKNRDGNPVSFRNKYNAQVTRDMIFFLSDMTFEGTSFNDMAVLGGLTDGSPNRIMSADGTQVIRIISGQDPKLTLRWKVPTIWEPLENRILAITDRQVDLNRLESNATPHVDIDYSYFHIKMNVVKDIVTTKDYRTAYDNTGTVIVRETGGAVSGLNANGEVVSSDGFVSYTFDQTHGIIPGTEYEKMNIRLYFWNNAQNEQAISSRLVYGFDTGGFPIENKDNVFQSVEGRLDSLFTPMMYEVSKVDVDKMEIRIHKIKSRNYTELYYQVQDAGTVVELLESTSDTGTGIKVPDASIPGSTGWGSVIVEIPLDQEGRHPEHYYRVVVTDGNSNTPLGSLALDLRMLGNDTGKPPVPREIEVTPEYGLKQNVTYGNNQADGEVVRIPSTNLKISFEKPLLWMTREWGDIQSEPDSDNDFTFHILLNTFLSNDVKIMETRVIGEQKVTVYVPVKEKRVLTIDKHDLHEDPGNTSRLVYQLDGTKLFWDYTVGENGDTLAKENNVDTDINGRADYPTFLLPNTMYYLRMFSTRRKDNSAVNWAENTGLGDKISYISPVVSFTTFPSKDLPVPMPNLVLGADVEPEPDPVTGKPIFSGITVDFPKILDDNDWLEYTRVTENRKLVYELYISDSTDEDSFILLQPPYMDTLQTIYPDEKPGSGISALVTSFPTGQGEALKPNTTYYFKLQAKLYVNNEAEPFLLSDFSPIKSITTPKTDSGSMDDLERKPRTPVEFSIAVKDGQPELTDAKVTLNWLHAEQDVVYEMVCTKERLDEDYDYVKDDYHIGNLQAPGFLNVYSNYKPNAEDNELVINVLSTPLKDIGFTYNEGYSRIARFPANLPFLRPNTLYYFSLRAVRNRGQEDASYSDWVSIPVTTRMVAPPDFIEAVNDVQLGFKVMIAGIVNEEDVRVMVRKGNQLGDTYQELSRAKYSVVKDGRDYYIRLYDLAPDTWYDILVYYPQGNGKMWYDSSNQTWQASGGTPLKMKTRNTLKEIEIRFAGEDLYDYFMEIRTDEDEDYQTLQYSADGGRDYGYTLADETEIEFYREKIAAYVIGGQKDKFVYYAKISSVQQRKADGTYGRKSLPANTRYYVKVWARNISDSTHIGPVSVRTDFSQEEYDKDRFQEEISHLFQSRADGLTRKLYFTVNEPDKTANRVILKGSTISGMLKVSGYSGVTVDISAEKPEIPRDIILIPMEVLSMLQKVNSRLTIQTAEGELTLTGETFNLDILKKAAAAYGVKETMLELTIERKQNDSVQPPQGLTVSSKVFELSAKAVGMKRTYAEMNEIIYDILKKPTATGPFKYGLMDRELYKLLGEKTTLTYKSQAELDGAINILVDRIEEELSLYIRDILDGGRDFSASRISNRELKEFAGGMKLKMLHDGNQSLARPMVLKTGKTTWQDPAGVKAWLFPYVLMNCKTPGQYAVFSAQAVSISVPGVDGSLDPDLRRLSQKYDLQKVFGSKNLYSGDFVSKDSAIALFEVVAETGNETMGLSTPAKMKYYQLDQFLPVSGLKTNINRQQATSLVVEIYAYKSGVSTRDLRPTTHRYVRNAAAMSDPVYHRLLIALDLGLTGLESDNTYKGESLATIEEVLKETITVLDLLGEW